MEGTKKIYVAGNYIEKQDFKISVSGDFHYHGGTDMVKGSSEQGSKNNAAEEDDEQPDEPRELPVELQKKGIIANLDWLCEQELLDETYQPMYRNVQVNQLAAIVDRIGEIYNIKNRWSIFERFWGKPKDSLRSSFAQLNANSEKHKEFAEKILKHIR